MRLWAGAVVCHKRQTARSDTTHLLRPRLVSSHTFKRDSSITLGTKGPICCKTPLESLTCHLRCVLHRTQRFLGGVPAHSSPHTLSQRLKWNMCAAQSPERESAHLGPVFGNWLWCHTDSVWGGLRDAGKSMNESIKTKGQGSSFIHFYSARIQTGLREEKKPPKQDFELESLMRNICVCLNRSFTLQQILCMFSWVLF